MEIHHKKEVKKMDSNGTFHTIKEYLFANKSSDFAVLFLNSIYDQIRQHKVVTILAPTDEALARLAKLANMSVDDIVKYKEGRTILDNHISSHQFHPRTCSLYVAINGTRYDNSERDINALDIKSFLDIRYVRVYIVNKILCLDEQLEALRIASAKK